MKYEVTEREALAVLIECHGDSERSAAKLREVQKLGEIPRYATLVQPVEDPSPSSVDQGNYTTHRNVEQQQYSYKTSKVSHTTKSSPLYPKATAFTPKKKSSLIGKFDSQEDNQSKKATVPPESKSTPETKSPRKVAKAVSISSSSPSASADIPNEALVNPSFYGGSSKSPTMEASKSRGTFAAKAKELYELLGSGERFTLEQCKEALNLNDNDVGMSASWILDDGGLNTDEDDVKTDRIRRAGRVNSRLSGRIATSCAKRKTSGSELVSIFVYQKIILC